MKNKEPTSGLEPLTCSLRVINQVLQGFTQDCKFRLDKLVSFLRLALCCTVLRSRWCQSGVSFQVFAGSIGGLRPRRPESAFRKVLRLSGV